MRVWLVLKETLKIGIQNLIFHNTLNFLTSYQKNTPKIYPKYSRAFPQKFSKRSKKHSIFLQILLKIYSKTEKFFRQFLKNFSITDNFQKLTIFSKFSPFPRERNKRRPESWIKFHLWTKECLRENLKFFVPKMGVVIKNLRNCNEADVNIFYKVKLHSLANPLLNN